MSVSAKYDLKLVVDETVALGLDNVADPEITHELDADAGTLDANSSPPATKTWSDQVALVAGSATLDLTDLASGDELANRDFTGLKLRLFKLACPSGNSAGITFERKDAVTGYNPFGADNSTLEKVTVLPGESIQKRAASGLETVDATHKDITLSGTGTEVIDVVLVAG